MVTYLGSRFWTFRHRVNQPLMREGILFVVLNVIGLAIAEAVIAITTYGLDMKSRLAYNAASVVGTGLGTIFRYFSYKKWVFLADAPGTVVAAGEAAVTGVVEPALAAPGRGRRAAVGGARTPRGSRRPALPGAWSTWTRPSRTRSAAYCGWRPELEGIRPGCSALLGLAGRASGGSLPGASAGSSAGARQGRGRAGCLAAVGDGAGRPRTWPASA